VGSRLALLSSTRVRLLERYNVPVPLIGGPVDAMATLALRQGASVALEFDTVTQTPLRRVRSQRS
jgi:Na+/glutamate symporter